MAILHGSWLLRQAGDAGTRGRGDAENAVGEGSLSPSISSGYLFIWGEVWRRITPEMVQSGVESAHLDEPSPRLVLPHPFAMTALELLDFLRSLQQAGSLQLPTPILEQLALAKAEVTPGKQARSSGKRGASKSKTPPIATQEEDTATPSSHWHTQPLALPSYFSEDNPAIPLTAIVLPQHSATGDSEHPLFLYPWQVEGICLTPAEATAFLNSLPLGSVTEENSFLSGDLRFWSHVSRWSLDLQARAKFLPDLEPILPHSSHPNRAYVARWQPLLDSAIDQVRLSHFIDRLPSACRMYQKAEGRRQKAEGKREEPGARSQELESIQNLELKPQNFFPTPHTPHPTPHTPLPLDPKPSSKIF
ncbi:hypothetical protein K9N68_09840 [Kovacikia minuta CCNUW1]|uniref:hypothetical protein n=1 Tax=Kovacikia minuta TaxID=2931930 RepID=UPI001CCB31AA|nr:hypothetical protein [Kovacikia minuta]UBF28151.1 hypothetical protein K9N68_09840 [Kovacikia minuta CCNUW1]